MHTVRASWLTLALALLVPFGTAGAGTDTDRIPSPGTDPGLSFRTVRFPGSAYTEVIGINSHDVFVGEFGYAQAQAFGFVHTSAGFRAIAYPGAQGTSANGIQ